mgnify:CR=1 FL=1
MGRRHALFVVLDVNSRPPAPGPQRRDSPPNGVPSQSTPPNPQYHLGNYCDFLKQPRPFSAAPPPAVRPAAACPPGQRPCPARSPPAGASPRQAPALHGCECLCMHVMCACVCVVCACVDQGLRYIHAYTGLNTSSPSTLPPAPVPGPLVRYNPPPPTPKATSSLPPASIPTSHS